MRRYSGADLITHLSRHETSVFTDAGFPEERLFPVTYGVSHRYYVPGEESERDIDLLAVGQDRGRDYATLFAAIDGTDLTLDLVCRPENLGGTDGARPTCGCSAPCPARSTAGSCDGRRSSPSRPRCSPIPTGSSVALEASSSGCCVVATDTPAMADYIADGTHRRARRRRTTSAGWREALLRLRADDATATPARRGRPPLGRGDLQRRAHVDRARRRDAAPRPGLTASAGRPIAQDASTCSTKRGAGELRRAQSCERSACAWAAAGSASTPPAPRRASPSCR